MSRGLVFSPEYNLITICWMMEMGILERECDVLLPGEIPGLAARLEKTGYFKRIFKYGDCDQAGATLARRDQAIDAVLRNAGRPFRRKSGYMELLSPERFYSSDTQGWDKCYSGLAWFESIPPQMNWMLWKKCSIALWEHSLLCTVKGGSARAFPSAYFSEERSLWYGLHDVRHPRDQLSELIVSCPELIPRAYRERATVRAMPKIDRGSRFFVDAMNDIFAADAAGGELPSVIFFPLSIGSLRRVQALEQWFLDRATAILGKNAIAVKEHPSTIYEEEISWRGVSVLQNAALPWELQILNHDGWDRRLLISSYCTTALLTPKAFFDDEPFVLNLCRLVPELEQGICEAAHRELAEDVGRLYRAPEKYCIPEAWDEAWDFLRAFKTAHGN